jgi:hypothetical protein
MGTKRHRSSVRRGGKGLSSKLDHNHLRSEERRVLPAANSDHDDCLNCGNPELTADNNCDECGWSPEDT